MKEEEEEEQIEASTEAVSNCNIGGQQHPDSAAAAE